MLKNKKAAKIFIPLVAAVCIAAALFFAFGNNADFEISDSTFEISKYYYDDVIGKDRANREMLGEDRYYYTDENMNLFCHFPGGSAEKLGRLEKGSGEYWSIIEKYIPSIYKIGGLKDEYTATEYYGDLQFVKALFVTQRGQLFFAGFSHSSLSDVFRLKKTLSKRDEEKLNAAVSEAILDDNKEYHQDSECSTEGHIILGTDKKGSTIKAYLLTEYNTFGFENGCFVNRSGSIVPAVMTFDISDGDYKLNKIEYAKDGSYYAPSIKKMFPKKYENRVLSLSDKDIDSMWKQCCRQAEDYLKSIGREAAVCSWGDLDHVIFTDLGMPVDISNRLSEILKWQPHYEYIGNIEYIEDGVRYVYATEFFEDSKTLVFTKNVYDTNETVSCIKMNILTGEILYDSTGTLK